MVKTDTRLKSLASALLCALTLGLAALLVHPVMEAGIMDDASYTRTAEVFARTGHIVYNGWGAMPIGWQLDMAAVAIKLFGFSMTVVRLSMLPVAMGSAILLHRIFVRCGVSNGNAVLGTLSVVLSPLFVVMSLTYMTDISGLFVVLVCLYACLRALTAEHSRAAIEWVCLAVVSNALGGTARQIAWLGMLVMVPSTLWLLRRRTRVLAVGIPVLLAGVAFMIGVMRWFAAQPYTIPEALLPSRLGLAEGKSLFFTLLVASLSFSMLFLPVLLPFGVELGRRARAVVWGGAFIVAALLGAAVLHRHRLVFGMIRMPGSLMLRGEARGLNQGPRLLGMTHHTLTMWISVLLTALSIAMLGAVLTALLTHRKKVANNEYPEPVRHVTWRTMGVLFVPFCLAYVALLLPRATQGVLFLRYLLPLAALAAVAAVRFFQDNLRLSLPRWTGAAIACIALYGVADAHDFFAMGRARIHAVEAVQATGVPLSDIDAGTSSNMWNYIGQFGHFNDPKIRVPANAYVPMPQISAPGSCHPEWDYLMPGFKPSYAVSFTGNACGGPAGIAPVTYSAWLPPRQRKIYVVRYAGTPSAENTLTEGLKPQEDQ